MPYSKPCNKRPLKDIRPEDRQWFFKSAYAAAMRRCPNSEFDMTPDVASYALVSGWKRYARREPKVHILRAMKLAAVDWFREAGGRHCNGGVEKVGYKLGVLSERVSADFDCALRSLAEKQAQYPEPPNNPWRWIDRLPRENQRQVLTLRYVNDLQFKEIAQEMSLSITRVRNIHNDSLAWLRERFTLDTIEEYPNA